MGEVWKERKEGSLFFQQKGGERSNPFYSLEGYEVTKRPFFPYREKGKKKNRNPCLRTGKPNSKKRRSPFFIKGGKRKKKFPFPNHQTV